MRRGAVFSVLSASVSARHSERFMIHVILLLVTELTAVTHLLMSFVLFYFARRTVRYLSQAWIMLILGVMYSAMLGIIAVADAPRLGILHPYMLLYLVVCSYLQSLYPLGLSMPGYLQWGRMWSYASPAIALILIYMVGMLMGSDFARVYEAGDIRQYFLSGDVVLRLCALLLSSYYIINIFVLPRRLVRQFELRNDLVLYGTLLGCATIYFVALTLRFHVVGFIVYQVAFMIINLFLSFRILRPVLDSVQYPEIVPVGERPSEKELRRASEDDFNQANKQRFDTMEYVMQREKPFKDCEFTRERLCRLVGFNRHLVLQSLRSQGYNDVHEYITRYRVSELRRAIDAGEVSDLRDLERYGFRATKTAVLAFEKYEGLNLPAYYSGKAEPPAGEAVAGEAAAGTHPASGEPPLSEK